jgi:hypothetical protein
MTEDLWKRKESALCEDMAYNKPHYHVHSVTVSGTVATQHTRHTSVRRARGGNCETLLLSFTLYSCKCTVSGNYESQLQKLPVDNRTARVTIAVQQNIKFQATNEITASKYAATFSKTFKA